MACGTYEGPKFAVTLRDRSIVSRHRMTSIRSSHPCQACVKAALCIRQPLVPPLRQLVAGAGALTVDLRAVADGIDAVYIGVYALVAAETDVADSDIDVLVVGDLSVVAAQTAFKAIGRKQGRQLTNTLLS